MWNIWEWHNIHIPANLLSYSEIFISLYKQMLD